jgi:hypothetical protein
MRGSKESGDRKGCAGASKEKIAVAPDQGPLMFLAIRHYCGNRKTKTK